MVRIRSVESVSAEEAEAGDVTAVVVTAGVDVLLEDEASSAQLSAGEVRSIVQPGPNQ